MAWPTPQDYNEAIQNPRICFSDPELRQGSPALTLLGLPKPITGAFASVYRVDCQHRRWAVRCFLREYADQRQRYSAISRHLQVVNLPCMVGFQFLEEGILVHGRWYPILKMEWIEGEPLSEYVSRNLDRQKILKSLTRRWFNLINSLRRFGIAHGDFQHGNILVSGGKFRLIDYDAMYVPALSGLTSHEVGHRNYQHPNRSGSDFGPDLDNFSAWVIAMSLSALAIDAALWGKLNAGDEGLLFRREDFESPSESKALGVLETAADPRLQRIATELKRIFSLPIACTPMLSASPLKAISQPRKKNRHIEVSKQNRFPSWLLDHLPTSEFPNQATRIGQTSSVDLSVRVSGEQSAHEAGSGGPADWLREPIREYDKYPVTVEHNLQGYRLVLGADFVKRYFKEDWHDIWIDWDGASMHFNLYTSFWAGPHELGGDALIHWFSKRKYTIKSRPDTETFNISKVRGNRFRLDW